jgi:omega-6 fatty acid desaturase (delta-12 desaturase)
MMGIFGVGHDCGHFSFSRSSRANLIVGHFCTSIFITPFHGWRVSHNHHHAHTQIRKQDPDLVEGMVTHEEFLAQPKPERNYTRLGLATPLGLLLGFWQSSTRKTFVSRMIPQVKLNTQTRRQLLISNTVMVATMTLLLGGLHAYGGLWAVMRLYVFPVLIASVIGSLLILMHHTHEDSLVFDDADWTPFRGQVVSTFEVRYPKWMEWFWLGIFIHLPHHLAVRVPWYHLEEASRALATAYPAYHQKRKFRLSRLTANWARPLLKRDPSNRRYVMAAFPVAPEAAPVAPLRALIRRSKSANWSSERR